LLATASMVGWIWAFGRQRAEITPFGSSLLLKFCKVVPA
jgi:hypothetical protein